MIINKQSWHYKLYAFMLKLHSASIESSNWRYERTTVGLCEYMRVIFLWGPLAIFATLALVAIAFAVVFVVPYNTAGMIGVMISLASYAIMVSFVYLAYWAFALYDKYIENSYRKQNKEPDECVSSSKLAKSYMSSLKSKICPIMEIKNDK